MCGQIDSENIRMCRGDEDESKTGKMANPFYDRSNHRFVNHIDIGSEDKSR